MLTNGFNHVAILTNDAARLHAFYEEVFEAEVLRDGPETPDDASVRLSIVHVGPHSELNVFEIDGNTEAERQTPMFARVASTTWRSRPSRSRRSRPSASASSHVGPPTGSSPTSARCSACSSATPTGSSARCVWPTPTRAQECRTHQVRPPPDIKTSRDGPGSRAGAPRPGSAQKT